MDTIYVSTILVNVFIGCICFLFFAWALSGVMTVITDFRRDQREKRKAEQDDEYHRKRMKDLDK